MQVCVCAHTQLFISTLFSTFCFCTNSPTACSTQRERERPQKCPSPRNARQSLGVSNWYYKFKNFERPHLPCSSVRRARPAS